MIRQHIFFSAPQLAKLKTQAVEQDISLSELVRRLIEAQLQTMSRRNGKGEK